MALDLPTKKKNILKDLPGVKLFGPSGYEAEVDSSGYLKIDMTNASIVVTATNLDIDGEIDIKNAVVTATALGTSGFDSARANQTPVSDFTNDTTEETWTTIYTVTAGKTFYLTDIHCTNLDADVTSDIKLGVSSSAVFTIGYLTAASTTTANARITFKTPMTFSAGTAIQLYQSSAGAAPDTDITLIGWEE